MKLAWLACLAFAVASCGDTTREDEPAALQELDQACAAVLSADYVL